MYASNTINGNNLHPPIPGGIGAVYGKAAIIQWRSQEFSFGGLQPDTWRARGARAYTGVWGQSPQRGPGVELLEGVRGRSPLKLKAVSLLGGPLIRQICIILGILQSHKTTYIT